MAFIECDFFSNALGMACSMNVIIPDPLPYDKEQPEGAARKHPTLYLLHGGSDDHTIWHRRTAIERYADAKKLAVIMPGVHLSFYADMAEGQRYWTFVSEELPHIARSLFPLSDAREDNFVAGLSMGGYGAFKMALSHPDRFAAVAGLSSAADVVRFASATDMDESRAARLRRIFGDLSSVKGSDNDLFHLADTMAAGPGPKPRIYQWCGTDEGGLYTDNVKFRDHLQSLGLDLTYVEGPGTHTWSYWDDQIEKVIAWLPLRQ
jgi:putative tributyrin esterase